LKIRNAANNNTYFICQRVHKYRAIEKKIEMAMINTLQLAARKNLIQMSSDVINYNSNCHPGLCTYQHSLIILENNVFKNRPCEIPELMQVITDNCNLIDVPTLRRSFENMKRRE
jgi:hypothetical protein